MILLTGKRKKTKNRFSFSGFTLIELLLVTVIILALVGISTPLFKRTYDYLRLTSSVKELAAIMKFCRERAVLERRNYSLSIDAEKKFFQALVKDEDEQEFKTLKGAWGRTFKLPDDVDIEGKIARIDFSPDGNMTQALIYLSNRAGSTYTIAIEQDTGFIRIYDYRKE